MQPTKPIDLRALPSWPPDSPSIAESVRTLFESGQWADSVGAAAGRLAKQLASRFGAPHVRLTASGTAAIEIGLKAIPIPPGSEVIIAGFDYPGNIRAIESCGARPVIVDVLPDRWVIDIDQVEKVVGKSTSAIIASHLYGDLFDAPRLRAFADDRGIALLEDACQVHGARIGGQPAGSWGHVSALSFGRSKLMTSGCGGALLATDARIAQRATLVAERPSPTAPLSQLQAAALLPQLETLAELNIRRHSAMQRLRALLADSQLWKFAAECLPDARETAYYKAAWLLPDTVDRDAVLSATQAAGLPCGPGFRGFLRHARHQYPDVGRLPNSHRCIEQGVVMDHRVLLATDAMIEQVSKIMLGIETRCQTDIASFGHSREGHDGKA